MPDYDIFISYRTTHRQWVETLARNLREQGYRIFLDAWELIPGGDFTRAIYDALRQANKAILVATPDASESGWVQQEYSMMFNRRQNDPAFRFVPVVLGEFPDFPFLQNVQAVDFGDGTEAAYRLAFHRLLCGLEEQTPGDTAGFDGPLTLPGPTREQPIDPASGGVPFSERVLDAFVNRVPLLLLAQADAPSHLLAGSLRKKAEARYGNHRVFHLFPPTSTHADSPAYFGRLAKQFGNAEPVENCWQWAEGVAERLEQGGELFLLISGFENGPEELRGELAGELRQLHQRFDNDLHLVLMGGERLAALRFAHGIHSLLNYAEPLLLPEPDAELLQATLPEERRQACDQQTLNLLLRFTGGHPRLTQYCLQQSAATPGHCEQLLRASPLPGQLFSRFQDPARRPEICGRLQQDDLGPFDLWSYDEVTRELFWNNLLREVGGRLCWRCGFVREMGREMLGCP